MKYKVIKDTELGKQLANFFDRVKSVNDEAFALAKEFGTDRILLNNSFFTIAGGITGFQIDGTPPENWVRVGKKYYDNVYFPSRNKKVNKELISRIDALPLMTSHDINEVLKSDEYQIPNGHGSYRLFSHPYVSAKEWGYLIEVKDPKYKPLPDMIEILESEYNALSENN